MKFTLINSEDFDETHPPSIRSGDDEVYFNDGTAHVRDKFGIVKKGESFEMNISPLRPLRMPGLQLVDSDGLASFGRGKT